MAPTKRLTDQAVARIKPPKAGKIELPDGLISGMQLRVTNRGVKTFALRYRVKGTGKARRLTLGQYPVLSLGEARTKAKDALQAVDEGRVNGGPTRGQFGGFIEGHCGLGSLST